MKKTHSRYQILILSKAWKNESNNVEREEHVEDEEESLDILNKKYAKGGFLRKNLKK